MTKGLIILHLGLVVTAFLIMLNGYLRGGKKTLIDVGLSLLWIILLAIALFLFGWKSGILAAVLSFVYAFATKPIAAALSRKLLGYRTTLQPADIRRDSTNDFLTGKISTEEWFVRTQTEKEEENLRLKKIADMQGIAQVLKEKDKTEKDLKENLLLLTRAGLGDLSWEIIQKPDDLRLLLELQEQGLPLQEIAVRLLHR